MRPDCRCICIMKHVAAGLWRRYVASGLTWAQQDAAAVWRHVQCAEDGQALRDALPGLGLAAFVGNGSVLPRCAAVLPWSAPCPAQGGRQSS